MGLWRRLKRLWALSEEPLDTFTEQELDAAIERAISDDTAYQEGGSDGEDTRRMATVVQDDPIDLFPEHKENPDEHA